MGKRPEARASTDEFSCLSARRNGIRFSLWDKWRIRGGADFTVAQFIAALRDAYHVDASMIVQGVKMIYVPMMPGHKKRLAHPYVT